MHNANLIWLLIFGVCKVRTILSAVDDTCLNCICKVESNCSRVGCNMETEVLSCGYFQFNESYYIDCNQPGKRAGESTVDAWKRCADDFICAKGCVITYVNYYAPLCQKDPTCKTYARVHDGGPSGCNSESTIAFSNEVEACLQSNDTMFLSL